LLVSTQNPSWPEPTDPNLQKWNGPLIAARKEQTRKDEIARIQQQISDITAELNSTHERQTHVADRLEELDQLRGEEDIFIPHLGTELILAWLIVDFNIERCFKTAIEPEQGDVDCVDTVAKTPAVGTELEMVGPFFIHHFSLFESIFIIETHWFFHQATDAIPDPRVGLNIPIAHASPMYAEPHHQYETEVTTFPSQPTETGEMDSGLQNDEPDVADKMPPPLVCSQSFFIFLFPSNKVDLHIWLCNAQPFGLSTQFNMDRSRTTLQGLQQPVNKAVAISKRILNSNNPDVFSYQPGQESTELNGQTVWAVMNNVEAPVSRLFLFLRITPECNVAKNK
jgi:hypothetical protein